MNGRLRPDSHGNERNFYPLKNLSGHSFRTEPCNIFALFTRNWRTGLKFNLHAQSATFRNPKWRQERERLTIVAELPRIHATTPLPYKNLDGEGVCSVPVKFSTVPAKNLSPIWAFKFLNSEAWFRVKGTPKCTNLQLVENSSGTVWIRPD